MQRYVYDLMIENNDICKTVKQFCKDCDFEYVDYTLYYEYEKDNIHFAKVLITYK